MRKVWLVLAAACVALGAPPDTEQTSMGPLKITPITHATVMLEVNGQVWYIDPYSKADYSSLPKADVILITDIHGDHMDPAAIAAVKKSSTFIIAPEGVVKTVTDARVLNNGDSGALNGINIEAVPAYNLTRGPEAGKLYHDKGRGNGYVLTFGDKRVYFSGDTEVIPEMKALKNIDIAFVCMNLPYTMTPEEAAEGVKAFQPKIVYPYHYRGSDVAAFQKALQGQNIDVRLREWYPQ
jgi:L-ascorbate metabolism protein UlaG (beta-lactamase superfamily)